MAVAYVTQNQTLIAVGAAATSVTVTTPAAAVGDLLVALICMANSSAVGQVTFPGDFISLVESTGVGHAGCSVVAVGYRVVTGTEAGSYTFTNDAANTRAWVARIAVFSGADTQAPCTAGVATQTDTAATSPHDTGTLVVPESDCMIVGFWGGRVCAVSAAWSSAAQLERADNRSGTNTTNDCFSCFDTETLAAAASITRTATSSCSAKSAQVLIAVRPFKRVPKPPGVNHQNPAVF